MLSPEDLGLLLSLPEADLDAFIEDLPPAEAQAVLDLLTAADLGGSSDPTPAEQAARLDPGYRIRPHVRMLADTIERAMRDVEQGRSRRIIVTLPPRAGKSTLTSLHTPSWVLRRHPSWPVVLLSHEANFATYWGRQVRRQIESGQVPGVTLAGDAGAASEWETTAGGGVLARGVKGSLTGRGAKVMIIDDPVKDYADAHSKTHREALWDWWLSVAQTRLEPPSLVLVVMTRWHEDDFVGRLLSDEREGDPSDWEVIRVPAVAEEGDPLGREVGEPLLSPLLDESPEEASARWAQLRRDVGAYTWASLYQQRPAPDEGSIFDASWWRFWTRDPALAEGNDSVFLLPPGTDLRALPALTAWDAAFKGESDSDYVVGQTWTRLALGGSDRYLLVDQDRKQRGFTDTVRAIEAMSARWPMVDRILIEDKANGPAVIDVLRRRIPKVRAWPASASKVERARAVTPLVEDGKVLLPHPSEAPWVEAFINEARDFPHASHDDQVDALAHALNGFAGSSQVIPYAAPVESLRSSPWAMGG